MIRQGELCKSCTDCRCADPGSKDEPIEMECPVCDGEGCDHCDDGTVKIEDCPNKYCQEVASVASMGDLFSKGLPPIAGGVLDQSSWFVQAVRIMERDEEKIKYDRASQ